LGPNRKMVLQGSAISVPSFIISPQSEVFFDLADGLLYMLMMRLNSNYY